MVETLGKLGDGMGSLTPGRHRQRRKGDLAGNGITHSLDRQSNHDLIQMAYGYAKANQSPKASDSQFVLSHCADDLSFPPWREP